MTLNHVIGILGLGLLFALFAMMHLWRGDQQTTRCGGDGKCGNCHGDGNCKEDDHPELDGSCKDDDPPKLSV